ncbi:MAG: addiction module protein [Bacteroidia bacterium]
MSDILKQIDTLSPSERWGLVYYLLQTLREEKEDTAPVPDWQIDIAISRAKDIDSGKSRTLTKEEFWKKLNKRAG